MDGTPLFNSVAPLRNVGALVELIDRVQKRGHGLPGMATFYGPSGYGKTTAAIYAANKYRAYQVQVKSAWTAKKLCTAILQDQGLQPARTIADMVDQIAEEAAKSGRPLIIDEADHILTDRSIEIVRRLHDTSWAPVILMGEEALPQKLVRWERVHGRMLSWVGMEEATRDDVDHLAKIYARGLTLGQDLKIELLRASRGSIRNVSTNLSHVREFAQVQGLSSVTLVEWGQKPFHTGEAPQPRHATVSTLRRGAVA